jgi:hypothetical protein
VLHGKHAGTCAHAANVEHQHLTLGELCDLWGQVQWVGVGRLDSRGACQCGPFQC